MAADNELSALIVRNIADIERIKRHLDGELRRELAKAIARTFESAKHTRWRIETDDDWPGDNWMAMKNWIDEDNVEKTTFRCSLEVGSGFEEEESWLAHFTGTAPSRVGMAFYVNNGTGGGQQRLKKILNEDDVRRQRLTDRGWEIDPKEGLRLPVRLQLEELASAFEEDDLALALDPIERGIGIVIESQHDLNNLRDELLAFGSPKRRRRG